MSDIFCDNLQTLLQQARLGFQGFPVGTLAFFGADDQSASKAIAMVIANQQGEMLDRQEYFLSGVDIRSEDTLIGVIKEFFEQHKVLTVATSTQIADCPHEEGIDYEQGIDCPQCVFWKGKKPLAGIAPEE